MAKEDKDKLKEKWDSNTQKRSPDAPKQVLKGRYLREDILVRRKQNHMRKKKNMREDIPVREKKKTI